MFKRLKSKIIACFSVLGLGVTALTLAPSARVMDDYPIQYHTQQLNLANWKYQNIGGGQSINRVPTDVSGYEYYITGQVFYLSVPCMSQCTRYYIYFVDFETPLVRCNLSLLNNQTVQGGTQFIPTNTQNVVQVELQQGYSFNYVRLIGQTASFNGDYTGKIIIYDADIYDLYYNDVNDAYNEGLEIGSGAKVEPSIINLFGAIAQIPVSILGGLMSFEILGAKYFTIFASFLSIAVVLWVLKKVI